VLFRGLSRGAFNEGGGETKFAAKSGFAGRHFAVVGFVVLAGEVEEAVEEEDANFVAQGVAVGGGLAGSSFERDGEVTGVFDGEGRRRGEAEDVGGFVFATEALVELAQGRVAGKENIDCATEADGEASTVEELCQAGCGEAVAD
jgi:hypothetical protein